MVRNLLIKSAIVAIIIIAAIFFKVFISQYKEFKRAESAFSQQNYKDATVSYETTILFYTPNSPYIEKSIERMLFIASQYEQKNDIKMALDVYENLRSSLYAVRSFYQPYPEIIKQCDSKMAELLRKQGV